MRLVSSVCAALLLWALNAGAVSPGDSADSVREELGLPSGMIEIGTNRVLFYERGEVVLKNDRVTEHNLMSELQYAKKLRRDADRKALLGRLAEERRLQLEAEGLALKQSKLNDSAFANLPVVERVNFWRTFEKRYPMVPIDLELSTALAEYESSRLIAANRALAQRVNQLETRLYQAELNTYRSRSFSGWGFWGVGYYGGGRYPSRPPHHPNHPDKGKSNHDFNSKKGSIMATMDRARGNYDSSYNASRNAFYARTKP
jgi:hypothetical protein